MRAVRAWLARLGELVFKRRRDVELAAEMESHLQMHIADGIHAGLAPEEARRQAMLTLGGVEQVKESYRDRRGFPVLEAGIQDVRFGFRILRKNPGFTTVAVLTLALGIGATTAIFTLVHAVLLNSLPVTKPGELYRVGDVEQCCNTGSLQNNWSLFSYEQYKTFRDNTPGFTELAAFQAGTEMVGVRRAKGSQPAQSMRIEFISGNYFDTFGIGAYAGRVLTPDYDRKGASPVAVISYRAWREQFGADTSVVGGAFTINNQPFTVIGIASPSFFGDRLTNLVAFWIPISDQPFVNPTYPLTEVPQQYWLDLIGRISPGADPKQIGAHMQVELRQWLLSPQRQDVESDAVPKQTLHLSPGGAGIRMLRDQYISGLHLLIWISTLVLAIACINVANLMLVRATARKSQTSIQAALGAPLSRQIRQALIESVMLALVGGVAGVAVAFAGTRLILRLAFLNTSVAIHASPSLPVLAFAFGVSLLTGILFGVAPAWIAANTAPIDALRGLGRASGRAGWAQKSLIVAQAGLSVVLLASAWLLTQSLRNMRGQTFGFETSSRYILHIDPQMAGYKPAQMQALYRELQDSVAAIPGVNSVSFSLYTPMEDDNWSEFVYIEGQEPPPPIHNQNEVSWLRVSAAYFATLGTKILEGRSLSEQDTPTSEPVAVVNQTFAKKFFNNEDPIGKHFGFYIYRKQVGKFEIVGVTEDTKYIEPTKTFRPMFFLPSAQSTRFFDPSFDMTRFGAFEDASHILNAVELSTLGKVPGLEMKVRDAIAKVNPDLAVIDFRSFAQQVDNAFSQQTMIAALTSLFGLVALVLASVGLYGVTAYSVERRTNEIGIRMALGAESGDVLGLVLREGGKLVLIGVAIGLVEAVGLTRLMQGLLYGVSPTDPIAFAGVAILLMAVALVACYIPARRAMRVDPVVALRHE
jgi:putative ABC transport system permease protein